MQDKYQRKINYIRFSITDRCNLRCRYCMPDGISHKVQMKEILTYEELTEVASACVEAGITRFKVTGGEPFARLGCADFIGMLKAVPGVEQVTLTTNGVLLEENLPKLLENGLDAVNVSLDTLNRTTFREITGRDALPAVLDGIRESLDAGLRVKVNTVLQRDENITELFDLVNLARDYPLDVRFIEMMPIGYGRKFKPVFNEDILKLLRERYPDLQEDRRIHGNGPASYVKIPGFLGSIGFISALHGKFCSHCNRIRLTSTGQLKPCLCYADTVQIREIFEEPDAEIRHRRLVEAIRKAISMKPEEHCFEKLAKITENREMVEIGG